MFLRCSKRLKDGKEHRYWTIVENKRVAGGKIVQRQVLYLGEVNDCQRKSWRKTIEVFEDGESQPRTVALFRRIAARPATRTSCASGSRRWRCVGPGNRARAGWPASFTRSSGSTGSGRSACRPAARAPAGI